MVILDFLVRGMMLPGLIYWMFSIAKTEMKTSTRQKTTLIAAATAKDGFQRYLQYSDELILAQKKASV